MLNHLYRYFLQKKVKKRQLKLNGLYRAHPQIPSSGFQKYKKGIPKSRGNPQGSLEDKNSPT